MSDEVKRVGRELVYQGTILEVYKDHMEFSNGNTAKWDFIRHDGAAACRCAGHGRRQDLNGQPVPQCIGAHDS